MGGRMATKDTIKGIRKFAREAFRDMPRGGRHGQRGYRRERDAVEKEIEESGLYGCDGTDLERREPDLVGRGRRRDRDES